MIVRPVCYMGVICLSGRQNAILITIVRIFLHVNMCMYMFILYNMLPLNSGQIMKFIT